MHRKYDGELQMIDNKSTLVTGALFLVNHELDGLTYMSLGREVPGKHFGHEPVEPRLLDPGMGVAVARRTVFRHTDNECFGKVADRVSTGNMLLLGRPLTPDEDLERLRLRNAIATGALITSGRHLQHGDETQPERNLEIYVNCASAATTFTKFYLLLNGAGVGRSYDDDLSIVDWHQAPNLLLYLSPEHPDYPHTLSEQCKLGIELGLFPYGTTTDPDGIMRKYLTENLVSDLSSIPEGSVYHQVEDSREGWTKAAEVLEAMTYREEKHRTLILDFSKVRRKGAPIAGMQDRPASGPLSVMSAFLNARNHVIHSPKLLPLWEQAMRIDHYFSVEVQVGGARRAARMATKDWHDPDILKFIRIKSEGGLWTSNNSVMVDDEFWRLVQSEMTDDPLSQRAHKVFNEVTECAYINGEPGFINGDMLEDNKIGFSREKPVYLFGEDFGSERYQVSEAANLLLDISQRAKRTRFPAIVNPCGEITLHTTGAVCTIADYSPLLACPVPLDSLTPGEIPPDVAQLWDSRIEDALRLGVRFLIRVNTMDALYSKEITRTNRIGIGPTGIHEYAWMRFGFDFNDLIDEEKSSVFWNKMLHFSDTAKKEGNLYSKELGLNKPITVTTSKPAGSTSKLFGLTEGVHLPARRQYLRWVQFKGVKDPLTGKWEQYASSQLSQYEERGYPMRELQTFPGITIVGFPTVPLLMRLNIGYRSVTASEASPTDQYRWLRLLEKYWLGEKQGNQISYTLKVFTDMYDLDAFRKIVRENQSTVKCCAILPSKPDRELGYEYVPEEEVSLERFVEIVSAINDPEIKEEIDLVHLQCASGACPI